MAISTISGKGWLVIPKEIRDKYGLTKGSRVHVIDYGGTISIVPAARDPIAETRGMLRGKTSLTDALLKSRAADEQREESRTRAATRAAARRDG